MAEMQQKRELAQSLQSILQAGNIGKQDREYIECAKISKPAIIQTDKIAASGWRSLCPSR
jgi:hypothetical protein